MVSLSTKHIQIVSISPSTSACKRLLTNLSNILFLQLWENHSEPMYIIYYVVKQEIELNLIVTDCFIIASIYSHFYNNMFSFQKIRIIVIWWDSELVNIVKLFS
jgi:hypothetical protein